MKKVKASSTVGRTFASELDDCGFDFVGLFFK